MTRAPGFSTFEYCEPRVLGFGHFIRLPATSVKSELWIEVPFHVNLHIFVSTSLGENVSAGRNAQRNLFSETLFIQDLSFDGAALVLGSFLLCFCGVFSACRNVLPSTFRGQKIGRAAKRSYCGGRSTGLQADGQKKN